MGDRKRLKDGIGIVYFTYPDGSKIRCVATACKEIVEAHNMIYSPNYLYDIEVCKPIPTSFFTLDSEVLAPEDDTPDKQNNLDRFLNNYIKNFWKRG